MKYSVCIDAVYMGKGAFTDAMKEIRSIGYNAYEFWSWWDKDIAAIERTQKELGLELATFCTKFINPGDAALREDYLEGLKESIRVAKQLECGTLIAQAGWDYESAAKEITRKQHRQSLIETMRRAGDLAAQADMTLVIEPLNTKVNHPGYHLSTSEDSFDLIDRIGNPNVKILFDIYHQQITEGDLIRNIQENIKNIGHFHAAGNPGRNEITRGEINYRCVFEAIAKAGYDRYIGLEYMTDENPREGLTEAKSILV